jgi:hypothetical protein
MFARKTSKEHDFKSQKDNDKDKFTIAVLFRGIRARAQYDKRRDSESGSVGVGTRVLLSSFNLGPLVELFAESKFSSKFTDMSEL